MPLILTSQIEVPDRQRVKIDPKPLADLRDSILANGMLQPILTLSLGDSRYRLIAGERRLRAVESIHASGASFTFASHPVEPGKIPIVSLKADTADLASLLQMEFDENKLREPLTWQEETAAIAAIVEARRESNPSITNLQIATEVEELINKDRPRGGVQVGPELSKAMAVAAMLPSRPDLQKATSAVSAYNIILRERQEAFQAELYRRRRSKAAASSQLWDLRHGDARKLLVDFPDGEIDLILADPPYGQNAHLEKYGAGVIHRYDDSEAYAQELGIFLIQEGWRITKPSANLFMFCSWKSFPLFIDAAKRYGWSPWYHPLIWLKGDGGHSPWGRLGFRHDYEIFMFATKGQRGIKGPISDVQSFSKVGSLNKVHGAEKPLALLERLIEVGSNPHDLVLDPTVGSGSTLLSATRLGRRSVGIELDEKYYNRALSRLTTGKDPEDAVSPETGPSAADA